MKQASLAVVLLISARALASNLVPNPSAEAGSQAPDSWRAAPAESGLWANRAARFGKRCLSLDAARQPAEWRSEPFTARAFQGFRLSGWIRSQGSTGWIEARFLGAAGRPLKVMRTPEARRASWTYVAADIQWTSASAVESAYIVCRARDGRCLFDGLRLSPLDRNILPNLELLPAMIENKPDPSGAVAGWHALPQTDSRPLLAAEISPGGPRGLRLGEQHPSGAASYLVDLPQGTESCVLTARVLSDGPITCAVSWFGPRGWMKDDTAIVRSASGRPQELRLAARPPAGANRVRATFSLSGGNSATIIPEGLIAVMRPQPAQAQVFTNQVGCEPDAIKTATIATTHFPDRLEDARFSVLDASGRPVLSGPLVPLGRVHEGQPDDWGAYYWLADFSALRGPGLFMVSATVGNQAATSHPFDIRRGTVLRHTAELAYRFLYYQRCGAAVPGWHGPCHLDDARLPDGSHLDLAGGWHDAGDYNKWMYPNGPPLVLYGMASAYLAHRAYFDRIDRDRNGRADLLDEILWGADWLMRMRSPKTGGLFGSITLGWSYWGLAERETDNIPGNDDDRPVVAEEPAVALAAAALAKVARCVSDGERFTRAAIEVDAYARKKEGNGADRLLACLAIWESTGQGEYLEQARACADAIGAADESARQGRALAALALFTSRVPEARADEKYRRAIKDSIAWLRTMQTQPFPLAAGRSGSRRDMREQSRLGENGGHMTLTSNAWAALACAQATGSKEAARCAHAELDWLFGLNPLDLCMLHGAGAHNPPQYHHRYFDYPNHRDGAVPGAIPNGIARPSRDPPLDLPFFGWLHREASTAEPWIPYNGYYLCALSCMDAGE